MKQPSTQPPTKTMNKPSPFAQSVCKIGQPPRFKFSIGLAAAGLGLALLTSPVFGVSLTLTTTAPTPGVDDVYNFEGGENDNANINNGVDANTYVAGDQRTQGQFFTTGPSASGYVLTDVWIRHCGYTTAATSGNGTWWNMGNGGMWLLRVTDASKTNQAGFVLRSETYISTGTENGGVPWNGGNNSLGDAMWLHFTLGTPVQVAAGTQYGIELTATGSPGLNYFEWLGNRTNVFGSGTAYTGITPATPGNSVTPQVGDRVFLVQLGHVIPAVQPQLTASPRFMSPGQSTTVIATIPTIANTEQAATLVITNNHPSLISLPGGANSLTLNFAQGATNVQTFNVQVLATGIGTLSVVTNASFTDASISIGTPMLASESFEYDATTQILLDQANGGSGFAGAWSQPSQGDIIAAGLTYGAGGATLVTSSNAAGVSGNGNEAFRVLPGTYGGVGGGTVYVGFLVQAPSGVLDWGGLSLWQGTGSENLFLGLVNGLSANDTWGFLQGGTVRMNYAGSITPGAQVDFLVYRIDFPTTNGGAAVVSFYANPPLNSTEPYTPTGSAAVNNFTFDRIRLGTADTLYFDEIRLGTHWTNVMQFTGTPQPLTPPAPTLSAATRFVPVGQNTTVSVSIPASTPRPLTITITNDNGTAFSISDTNAALTTVTFGIGATNVQSFNVQCLAEGLANLTVISNANINTATLAIAAQVSAGEPFAYEAGTGLLLGAVGGSGFALNAWTGGGDIITPGLTYPALVASSNAASAVTVNGDRTLSAISGVHGGTDGGTVWISFLVQGEFPVTQANAGVSLLSGAGVPFFMGLSTAQPNNGKWGFIGAGQGQDADFPNSVTPSTNTDLLVYRLDFPTSGDLVLVTFYANPPVGPTPPVTASGSGAVHNFTFDGLRIGSDFPTVFDELRLGGSWADVVPVQPVLTIQQTSATQVQIAWPATATGFALQSSGSVAGPWGVAGLSETTQGNQRVATDTVTGTAKFYRLAR